MKLKSLSGRVVTYLIFMPDCRTSGVQIPVGKKKVVCVYLPSLAYKFDAAVCLVMHRVILLTRFCELLTTVAILSGGARALRASMARRLVDQKRINTSGSDSMWHVPPLLQMGGHVSRRTANQ